MMLSGKGTVPMFSSSIVWRDCPVSSKVAILIVMVFGMVPSSAKLKATKSPSSAAFRVRALPGFAFATKLISNGVDEIETGLGAACSRSV